jgi:hypothetical protein
MAQPMHIQPFQFQGPPGDKLGWEQRIVKWADEYLKKLRGGTLAYPHETGAGKPQAQSLRGYLLSKSMLAVLQNSSVDTSYGPSMRLSAENADTARVIPQQEQARQQYYLDLFADDVALLERIKSMLGSQPVLEKEAVWTTFGKVFTDLDRSRITKPTELASTLEFAYEELKLSLGETFEQKLVAAWETVLDHLLKDVFAGQLKFVGDELARDRAAIPNPNQLLAKIRKACQAVHEIRNESRFVEALCGRTDSQASASAEAPGAIQEPKHVRLDRKRQQRDRSKEPDPKRAKTAECRSFKAGQCKFGANCKFSHATPSQPQPQKQPPVKPSTQKNPNPSKSNLKLITDEIEENGVAYVRAKDGKFYEKSPCSFCWQPESAMRTKHTNTDCPVRAKATSRAEQQRLFSSCRREKP